MRYFLSENCRPVALRLAEERTLCAFDFDGTLAPIVEHPDLARMRARTRRLLTRLSRAYPTVVISGRSRADLLRHLGDIPVARAVGNHGAETTRPDRASLRLAETWALAIGPALASLKGVWIENKGASLAIHYRQARNKTQARTAILAAVGELPETRTVGGKLVVNLMPAGAPGKGAAVALLRDRLRCRTILYVGDDDNDEDAFALEADIAPVRVGRSRNSSARYFLKQQEEIDALLDLMIGLRAAGGAGGKQER